MAILSSETQLKVAAKIIRKLAKQQRLKIKQRTGQYPTTYLMALRHAQIVLENASIKFAKKNYDKGIPSFDYDINVDLTVNVNYVVARGKYKKSDII